MESKYTVVGDFRHPHKDCEGDTLTDLSYAEKGEKIQECFPFQTRLNMDLWGKFV